MNLLNFPANWRELSRHAEKSCLQRRHIRLEKTSFMWSRIYRYFNCVLYVKERFTRWGYPVGGRCRPPRSGENAVRGVSQVVLVIGLAWCFHFIKQWLFTGDNSREIWYIWFTCLYVKCLSSWQHWWQPWRVYLQTHQSQCLVQDERFKGIDCDIFEDPHPPSMALSTLVIIEMTNAVNR